MINNSSLGKWARLNKKNSDQQFMHELIDGLSCSPFEASAVGDTVYKVYRSSFEEGIPLRPGQIRLQLVAVEASVNRSISEVKQVTVTLTLNEDEEDLPIRKELGVVGLRRHKIQRMCQEALDQGGLLTVEDLAYRVFNCGERTICRDLAYFREQGIFIPLRSTVQDMGRTLSHRLLIVTLWAKGKEYTEMSQQTCHSVKAIQNYVDKFKRTIALSKEGYDVHQIAFLLRLSSALVAQYIELYKGLELMEHRERELNELFEKKHAPLPERNTQEVCP